MMCNSAVISFHLCPMLERGLNRNQSWLCTHLHTQCLNRLPALWGTIPWSLRPHFQKNTCSHHLLPNTMISVQVSKTFHRWKYLWKYGNITRYILYIIFYIYILYIASEFHHLFWQFMYSIHFSKELLETSTGIHKLIFEPLYFLK